jgi:sugar phosphate isomerase/epimerase
MNLGVQLYPLLKELAADFDGTLARVASIGIRRVEIPSFILGGRPWSDVRQTLDRHHLRCPSVHFAMTELLQDLESRIAGAHAVGADFIVCAAPWIRDLSRVTIDDQHNPFALFIAAIAALDLDDWRWNADHLNRIGAHTKSAGLQLAYHSHNFEFRSFGDVVAYDELLRLTNPDLVKFELDCGWVAVAGRDPVRYLTSHPNRFPLLHARDYLPGFTPTTTLTLTSAHVLGPATPAIIDQGIVNYPAVIAAARRAGTVECFVEREPFVSGMTVIEALERDYRALSQIIDAAAADA